MRSSRLLVAGGMSLVVFSGCIPAGSERSAFETQTQEFGLVSGDTTPPSGGGSGTSTTGFRRDLRLVLNNTDPDSDVVTSFVAWVSPASIRSADQQDALINGGYVQLATEVKIGSVFTLVPGTFVFNGSGTAGRTTVLMTNAGGREPSLTFDLITPDVLLVFMAPPTSCESPAFVYEEDGVPLESFFYEGPGTGAALAGATNAGAAKTLAQIDVYECNPLRPGVFLKVGGGARAANEFFEGAQVQFDFARLHAQDAPAATVTITNR